MDQVQRLKEIVEKLRSESGCAWDRAQTHIFASDEERKASWEKIKKEEKAGKEWTEQYLPGAFDEAKELIDKAKQRKHM